MVRLLELTQKMNEVTYALYQTDDPDTRFAKIYKNIQGLELARKTDAKAVHDQKHFLMSKLNDTLFVLDNKMRELDVYKNSYASCGKEIEETSQHIASYMNQCENRLKVHMQMADDKLVIMDDKIATLSEKSLQ